MQDYDKSNPVAIGNFHVSQDMPNGRKMDVSLYVFAGETAEDLGRRLDDTMDVIERQRLRLELPVLQAALDNDMTALAHQMEALNELIDRSNGNGKPLASSEQGHIHNYQVNIKALKERIAKGEQALEKAKAGAK